MSDTFFLFTQAMSDTPAYAQFKACLTLLYLISSLQESMVKQIGTIKIKFKIRTEIKEFRNTAIKQAPHHWKLSGDGELI